MKRIAIFQSDFLVGGVQRSLTNILDSIDYSRCMVDLYLFHKECFYQLPVHDNLRIIHCDEYPRWNRVVYFELVKRFAKPLPIPEGVIYDVAIDFNSYRNECAVGALTVPARKRVMWIHNDMEIKRRNEPKYAILWHFFKAKLKYFDEFAAVSPGLIDGFRRLSGIVDKPVTVIPNYIFAKAIQEQAEEPVDFSVDPSVYNLATMGRICHQKGFDLLMDYLKQVVQQRKDIHLYLLGDGPDREKLEAQIKQLELSSHVTLLGNQANPFRYLKQMDGFVLTSRYEGQGMVIWEAKALGLELFLTKNLEAYNEGLSGREDLVGALVSARRREKTPDSLTDYNEKIRSRLNHIMELDGSSPAKETL